MPGSELFRDLYQLTSGHAHSTIDEATYMRSFAQLWLDVERCCSMLLHLLQSLNRMSIMFDCETPWPTCASISQPSMS